MLRIVYPICCGIDVHKKFIVATIGITNDKGVTEYIVKQFTTLNYDLIKCRDWLKKHNCTEVCMESTGKYWIPLFNVIEDDCNICLAQPKQIKAIPGHKTDKKDSKWICDLHKHNLVRGSYIPCKKIRQLRELSRYMVKLTGHASSELNRMQNCLTVSNIAIASVVSDINGKSSNRIIDYILSTQTFDAEYCKTLLHSSMKPRADEIIQAILGYELDNAQNQKLTICREHHSYIENCKSKLQFCIDEIAKDYEKEINIISSMIGISRSSAIAIISEIGTDMSVFDDSKHICSWAGLTSQNNESAGKKKSVRISRAGVYIKPLLVQCANAAIKSTQTNPYFRNKYNRIKKRRGHKRAIISICRMMLTCIYHMLSKGEKFNPIDTDYLAMPEQLQQKFEKQARDQAIRVLLKQGFTITKEDVIYAT